MYSVTIKVRGDYTAKVEANSKEEAIEKAKKEFEIANLNKINYIDSNVYSVEDDKGLVEYLY